MRPGISAANAVLLVLVDPRERLEVLLAVVLAQALVVDITAAVIKAVVVIIMVVAAVGSIRRIPERAIGIVQVVVI